MPSKPKECKYGCGTIITWNETQRFFAAPDGQPHNCKDWDKSKFPGVSTGNQYQNVTPNNFRNPQNFGGPNPNQEQKDGLISVEIRKNMENHLKHLEAINPNLLAIHGEVSNVCSLLTELIKRVQSLEEIMTVQKIKTGKKVESENGS